MTKAEAIAARDVSALTAILRGEMQNGMDNIPGELRAIKGWLVWRATEINATTGKMNKIPAYPRNGQRRQGEQGCSADLANLGTWADAAEAFNKDQTIAGVGLAMLPQFGLVALDADHCVKNGTIREDAACLAELTYGEISPSDTGIRAFWLGSASNGQNKETGFELYSVKQFVTVTGNRVQNTHWMLGGDALPKLDAELRTTLEALSRAPGGAGKPTNTERLKAAATDDARLQAIIDAGLYECDKGGGKHSITCPFEDQHSDAGRSPGDGDTVYMQPHTNGHAEGIIHCTHTHSNDQGKYWSAIGYDTNREAFNDLTGGQLATAESVVAVAATTSRRFPRQSIEEITNRPVPAWRVKGLIPSAGVAMIYGASTSGKSFFALDLGMDIARGEAWRGHTTKQGAVVYVCAEGIDDFTKRVTAYTKHHNTGALPFEVIDAAPNLMVKADVEALIAELMRAPVGIVFLDTLACMSVGGDENTAKDMAILIDHCKLISRMTGALVVLVHHTGKDESKGARGSSSLYGAMDTVIEISRAGDVRTAKVVKQKGGPDGQEFGFKLVTASVGVDEDGDDISSCVVEHTAAVPQSERKQEVKGVNQKIVMRALQTAFELTAEGMFTNDLAEAAAAELSHNPNSKRDTRKQKCMDAIDSLLAANQIIKEGGLLVPT